MSLKELKQLQQDDLKPLRIKLHRKQANTCPLLKRRCADKDVVVDHKHRRGREKVGKNGAGLVRGVIHFQANAFEGKVTNAFIRCGLHKEDISLPEFLRNLADYLERDPLPYIHPNEKPKPKYLGKRLFNKINKAYKDKYPKRKALTYPQGRKRKARGGGIIRSRPVLTKRWTELMKEFNITE